MDKRTLLALALSFVVLLFWSVIFGPQSEPPPPEQAAPYEHGQEPIETTFTMQEAPGSVFSEPTPGLPPEPRQIEEREIVVETELYRAVLSNLGPSIKSFQLKRYFETTDFDSPMIDLFQRKGGVENLTAVDFVSPSLPVLDNLLYEPNRPSLVLQPGEPPREIAFSVELEGGVRVEKIFRFYSGLYQIDVDMAVHNESPDPLDGTFVSRMRAFKEDIKTSYYSFVGLAVLLNNKLEELKLEKASEEKGLYGEIGWIAYEDSYFISAVVPDIPGQAQFTGRILPTGLFEAILEPPSVSVLPGVRQVARYEMYLGPRDLMILKEFGRNLDKAIDFGWTNIIAKPLLYLLRFFHKYIHNYGVAIILLTILVKILFWPLTHKSYKSMKEMQKLQPIMAKLREKYKNDRQKLNQEMMGLYKTYKVNPMGGCLPMVVQIPVFFALFRVLGDCIELRHAPFMLWINDLSAPDRLFDLPFQIPLMTPPTGIPVLTLLMGASMFLQQKMTPTPGDPAQAKIMMFLPIIFTFLFINFPSGLVLYWLINNLLSIGQQYRILKKPA